MSVRVAYEKNLRSISSNIKYSFTKPGYILSDRPVILWHHASTINLKLSVLKAFSNTLCMITYCLVVSYYRCVTSSSSFEPVLLTTTWPH